MTEPSAGQPEPPAAVQASDRLIFSALLLVMLLASLGEVSIPLADRSPAGLLSTPLRMQL